MGRVRKNLSISEQSAKYLKLVDNESDFVDRLIKQAIFENAAMNMAKDPNYLKEFKEWDSFLKDGLEDND